MLKHDQLYIKKQNKHWIYELIKERGPLTKPALAKETKMSPTSISRIVNELVEERLISESEYESSGVGRNAIRLELNKDARWSLGIEIDMNIIRLGLINLKGELVHYQQFDYHTRGRPGPTLEKVVELINITVAEQLLPQHCITGVGIGIPGYINVDTGSVIHSDQLLWDNVDVASYMTEALDLPTRVDNELKMQVIAEQHAQPENRSETMVLLRIGSGVGAAVLINGEIFRGDSNKAGEIGHSIVNPQGNLCKCGRKGCLATYVSEKALLHQASYSLAVQSMSELKALYLDKNPSAVTIFEQAVTYLAIALGNIYTTFNPSSIILSGDFFSFCEKLNKSVYNQVSTYMPYAEEVAVKYSNLEGTGVVLGAGLVAGEYFFFIRRITPVFSFRKCQSHISV